MHELKIHYSVENGGDGSAYPRLMESKELAMMHQKWMDEGWGEECIGYIVVESESPITIKDEVMTVDQMIADLEEQLNEDYMKEYKKQGEYPEWFKRLEGNLVDAKALKAKKNEKDSS